jgi:TM2 domain-containing membrane protein YozV
MRSRALRPLVWLTASLFGATGCSTSALIEPQDPTFARQQDRMQHTAELIEQSSAPAREKVLFLQAEGFFRYRFVERSQDAASSLASGAAAITDLPVLQSFANSLDLQDLRLRSADVATQLWETLLARHPRSTLRPLALYRLGWSYRNASVPGLPRRGPSDPLDALIREQPLLPITSFAREAKAVPWKSKDIAARWSVVPGLGQFYVGEPLNGAIRLAVALAATAAVVIPLVIAAQRTSELTWSDDWPLLVSGVGGLIVLSFDYTISFEDAMRGVVEWNERAETVFEASHPDVP